MYSYLLQESENIDANSNISIPKSRVRIAIPQIFYNKNINNVLNYLSYNL